MTTVPLSAISQTDDSGAKVDPEVGDVVDLGNAKATVESIKDGNAVLNLVEVNGEKVSDESPDDSGATPDDGDDGGDMQSAIGDAGQKAMGKMLMREAGKADKEAGY